jgi:riboflavin biosynthesis pyrimidine reductase
MTAREILKAIAIVSPSCETILIEGGPHLMGYFFAERCLDELFLTLAPQVAGRESSIERLGVVAEKIFAPEHPVWGTLVSVKRGGSHLFLRYAFESIGVM